MSKAEIDTAHQLAQVQINAERVIELVQQKYTILKSTLLPINIIKINEEENMSPLDK